MGRPPEQFYGVKCPPTKAHRPKAVTKWSAERDSILAAFNQAKKEYDDAYKSVTVAATSYIVITSAIALPGRVPPLH